MPNQTVPDKTLPYNLEAEGSVLGSMQIDPTCIPDVSLELDAADFYLEKSRLIFKAIMALYDQGKPVDHLSLSNQLDSTGDLERVGGQQSIINTLTITPSAMNAVHYARIVRETSMRRQLIESASQIARLAFDEGQDIGDVMSQAEGAVFKVRQGQRDDRMLTATQAVHKVSDRFDAIQRGEIPAAISTGYTDIDRLMTGFRRQELTILASRPGIGKTALLTGMVIKSAMAGHGTLFFSAEMSYEMIIKRMIQSAGVKNFPGNAKFKDGNWPELYERMAEINGLPLWIDDTPNPNVMDIRAKAMRLGSQHRIDHIFVDYIQLLKPPVHHSQRYLEISDISKMLKQISREMDNHVITAAQLGRGAEGIIPTLSDLKESGAQEEDADNVLLLHRERECKITPEHHTFEAQVDVAKQRNGPTGIVKLGWMPERVTYVPITKGVSDGNIQKHYSD